MSRSSERGDATGLMDKIKGLVKDQIDKLNGS
jgi:hypothetical protein